MSDTCAAWRTQNIGHLLFAATGRCVRDKLDVVHRDGFEAISDAQLTLFLHLDPAGTRLTTLAARAGLTKQSMIELVDKAHALALVDRRPDPDDRRAKIVALTGLGSRALATLHEGIASAEREVARVVGEDFLRAMKRTLGAYAAMPVSRDDAPLDPRIGVAGSPWLSDNIGRVFAFAGRRFVREVLGTVSRRDYPELAEVMLALFRNLDLEGTRLTAIAARARMTKQSMRELVDRTAALGFVQRRPDPVDGRAKIILFTPDGLALLEALRRSVARAEVHLEGVVGKDFATDLKARLTMYIATPSSIGERSQDRTLRQADHSVTG